MSAITKYDEALKTMPAPGGAGCHVAIMGAANLGALAGITEQQVYSDIRAAIPKGTRTVPDSEIIKTVRKAFNENSQSPAEGRPRWNGNPVPKKPEFDGKKEMNRLIEMSAGVQEVDLWEMSPQRLNREPGPWETIMFLESLYRHDDQVFIGEIYDPLVFEVSEHIRMIKEYGTTFPHIIANPMTGDTATTGDGTESFRCDRAVKEFRFALVEFDDLDRDSQVAFWHTMIAIKKMPVACLIDSGGKSIHAWIQVDLKSIDEWDLNVRQKMYDKQTGIMAMLGADTACKNPSRLSRLPGHFRTEKGKWQRLLYLQPATLKPTPTQKGGIK